MSRVGKNPILIPSGVSLDFNSSTRNLVVKGPLGELSLVVSNLVNFQVEDNQVVLSVSNPKDKFSRALWGTTRALIQNQVTGVLEGFQKEIELNGVGFRMELGSQLVLHIGFSHPVSVDIPKDIALNLEKNLLKGKSTDKQLLGNFFSNLHNLKPCDVYKQKGFKFPGRFYRKKVGKKGK